MVSKSFSENLAICQATLVTCYEDLFVPYRRRLKNSRFETTVNTAPMLDTAITRNPSRDRAYPPVAVTTRPVHAGSSKLLGKTPSHAAPPAPFRETGTPGTSCGVVAW